MSQIGLVKDVIFMVLANVFFTSVLWMSDIDGDAAKLRPAYFHTGPSHGFNKMSCIHVLTSRGHGKEVSVPSGCLL